MSSLLLKERPPGPSLTDLGFLDKPGGEEGGLEDVEKTRKAWRYRKIPLIGDFGAGMPDQFDREFCWSGFSKAGSSLSESHAAMAPSQLDLALYAYEAYKTVKRAFGHTPIESVAIIAMIRATTRSHVVEMKDIHDLFLGYKNQGLFPQIVHFASGNDLDRMFIDIKPEFEEEVKRYYGQHS